MALFEFSFKNSSNVDQQSERKVRAQWLLMAVLMIKITIIIVINRILSMSG